MKEIKIYPLALMLIIAVSCNRKPESKESEVKGSKPELAEAQGSKMNSLTESEKKDGWILMFDGKTNDGWKGFKKDGFPGNWEVVDGSLHAKREDSMTEEEKADRADIVFNKEFENFIFRLEWKISEGGNSGIFYLGKELDTFDRIYHTAPEMQVLDNDKHPDAKKGKDGNRKAGSLYDLIPAKPQNARAVGKWNEVEITINNREVTHKQNNVVVLKYKLDSQEWIDLVADSKFPGLNPNWVNVPQKGLVGLQDHGDDVWFRNLKIKEL